MFDNTKKWLGENWKKIVLSVVAAAAAGVLLKYVIPHLLSTTVVAVGGGLAVGYIVWAKVKLSDLQKIIDELKGLPSKL